MGKRQANRPLAARHHTLWPLPCYRLLGISLDSFDYGDALNLQLLINEVTGLLSGYATNRVQITPVWTVQLGLFLGCVRCHSSAELFFLLNFFVVESRCEVFGLEDLADLYVGLAFVGTALDPLDGLFERLDLPEPEAGDEFLLSVKGPSVTVQFWPEKWTRAPLEEG